MVSKTALGVLFAGVVLSGCVNDTTQDSGLDAGSLSEMRAGIWIDPNGCDHWIIDDGVEGYMTPRLEPSGKPVCREEFDVNIVDFDRKAIGDS